LPTGQCYAKDDLCEAVPARSDFAQPSGSISVGVAATGDEYLSDRESFKELKRKLEQATRLMDGAQDPMTKDRLAEMVRELERLVEIAAEREGLDDADFQSTDR
jgi:hypothetical protein